MLHARARFLQWASLLLERSPGAALNTTPVRCIVVVVVGLFGPTVLANYHPFVDFLFNSRPLKLVSCKYFRVLGSICKILVFVFYFLCPVCDLGSATTNYETMYTHRRHSTQMSSSVFTSSAADTLCETAFERLDNVEDVVCETEPTANGEKRKGMRLSHSIDST